MVLFLELIHNIPAVRPYFFCLWYFQELIRKTKDSVVKEKEDEDNRMKSQAKRLDYITRALRMEEMPVLHNKYNNQVRPREGGREGRGGSGGEGEKRRGGKERG